MYVPNLSMGLIICSLYNQRYQYLMNNSHDGTREKHPSEVCDELCDHGKLQYVMICLVLVGPALPGVSVSVG